MARRQKGQTSENNFSNVAPITESQKIYVDLMHHHDIVITKANAGSGKTLLALNFALKLMKAGRIDRIVYLRNPVNFKRFGSEGIGYLKGDQDDKMRPLLDPIMDNLEFLIPDQGEREYMLRKRKIEALPIEFIQGRSFRHTFIILDEAQNVAPELIHLVMTRISDGSKVIVIGGCKKATAGKVGDGLLDALERFDDDLDIATFEFDDKEEVPKHPLIKKINDAYRDIK